MDPNSNMNMNMGAPQPQPQPQPPVPSQQKSSSAWPVISTILILALLALGAFYFWNQRAADKALDNQLNGINAQGTSDEAAAIEADLNATDINNVDYDLNGSNYTSS